MSDNERLRNPEVDFFFSKDFITVEGLTADRINYIIELTDEMKELVGTDECRELLYGKKAIELFYEPSTRTATSFWAAFVDLGMEAVIEKGGEYSSMSKGESLEDTIRTFEQYCDLLVIRHSEVGAAKKAADAARKPVINAGDGVGEHPTQALLDIYTIKQFMGRLDQLNIVVAGDVLNGRTINSLLWLLRLYKGNKVVALAPDVLQMDENKLKRLIDAGMEVNTEVEMSPELVGWADVWYHTRVQKERFAKKALQEIKDLMVVGFNDLSPDLVADIAGEKGKVMADMLALMRYDQVKHKYIITPEVMSWAKQDMILMHPLPRVGEIAEEVDRDPRAIYFQQADNGKYVRMALTYAILSGEPLHV